MIAARATGPWQLRPGVLALCAFAVIFYLILNDTEFQSIGIHYDTEGGNPLVKIHPGTYLIVCAVLLHFLSVAHPLRLLQDFAVRIPGLIMCAFGMLIVLGFAVALHGFSGVAYLVDTFIAPAFLAILITKAPPRFLRWLFIIMLAILLANACLGIIESRLRWHLFPYIVDGVPVTDNDYFRATALEGHPLRNALLTSVAMVAVAIAPWPILVRTALLGPLVMGMLAFGGRTGLIVATLGCVTILAREYASRLRREPDAVVREIWAVLAVMLLGVAVLAAVFSATNFGGRIVNGDFTDSSSAARFQLFNIFNLVDLEGLLAGYDFKTIDAMTRISGLIAIENFWVFNLLFLGLIGFLLWFVALSCGLACVWLRSCFAARVMLLCFLVVASSNNSLAKKDSSLSVAFIFLVAVDAMTRKQPQDAPWPAPLEGLPHAAA